MARPLRVEFAGAVYHVMARGNECRDIVKGVNALQFTINFQRGQRFTIHN